MPLTPTGKPRKKKGRETLGRSATRTNRNGTCSDGPKERKREKPKGEERRGRGRSVTLTNSFNYDLFLPAYEGRVKGGHNNEATGHSTYHPRKKPAGGGGGRGKKGRNGVSFCTWPRKRERLSGEKKEGDFVVFTI